MRISRSALYRLFASLGGVAAYLRERRLARVHALLISGESVRRNHLGRLADDFGFTSASHFSRVVREQFGYSPREAREMSGAPVATAHAAAASAGKNIGRYGSWDFSVPTHS